MLSANAAAAAAPGDSQATTSFRRKRSNLCAEAAPFFPPAGEDRRHLQDGGDWLPQGWGAQASAAGNWLPEGWGAQASAAGDWLPEGWGAQASAADCPALARLAAGLSREEDSSASEPAGRDQPGRPRAGLSSAAAAWLGPEDGDPGDEGAAPQEVSRPPPGRQGRRRDWHCPKCGDKQFAKRIECGACGATRNPSPPRQPASRGSARSQGGLEAAARSRAAPGSDSDEEIHFGAGTARPLLTIV